MQSNSNIVSYERVSTQSQVDNNCGLETQRNRILEYAKEKGMVISRFYCDEGISGAVRDRAGLLELIADCEAKEVSKVIVYKMDRLARELTVSLWLEAQFKKYDVEVISVVDPELGDDPLEKAFRRIAYIFAELEKDVITARLKDGRINCVRKGERGCGAVPFGYKKVGDKLEINPNESQWVKRIFQWAVKKVTYADMIRKLSRAGVVTKRGKSFSTEGLKYVLRNQTYMGQTIFGDVTQRGIHEPIVGKRLFIKTQRILDGKSP